MTIPLLALALFFSAAAHAADAGEMRLATTTSTENSGLLDFILPDFESSSGCRARVIAVGTGRALRLGQNGDVDVLLVHSPPDEEEFVRRQFGLRRATFMRNDFVVVGPPSDPAGIAGDKNVVAAFAQIARGKTPFVSRGDESGTHKKEKAIWRAVAADGDAVVFSPDWHISAGVGMGQALLLADQKRAYALSDRGTFIAFRDKIDLSVLVENDPPLDNPYSVIVLNPAAHPHINLACASAFETWASSPPTQKKIADFRFHGEPLFFPAFPPPEEDAAENAENGEGGESGRGGAGGVGEEGG